MKRLIAVVALTASLTGCAGLVTSPEQAAAIATSAKPIQYGETVQGAANTYPASNLYYRFSGTAGQPVTITLRSQGPDGGLELGGKPGASNVTEYPNTMMPQNFNANGPHAEIRTLLPASPDGNYYVRVMLEDTGAYSLTLQKGLVVSQDILKLPSPILGTTGKYMSPFTEDDTITPWVEKGIAVTVGANVGQALGSVAALSASSDNLILALAGGAIGKAVGTAISVEAVGGWEFVKANSDQSFETVEDLGRYLHYRHSAHPQYKEVVAATAGIYPELNRAMTAVVMGR
ncbi:hypothetical protein KEM63_05680 [Halopseudomonas nanhaiensis]|uniref:hypothetical protein n=1 Tax=Halopseudomonas nanhaiensis TaxID=2830842 RepID=UPI001CBD9D93|nr:hypothetical protein [Halopseudomonas nanhaiensis]UAW99456.1 hypothetical protein KEM63_05680 [Halopseudomonas nanhaiensis]